jgi:tetratricopeptide (TPR) repeat protein
VKLLPNVLRAKGAILFSRGHNQEGLALNKHALELALEHDVHEDAMTGYFILSDRCFSADRYQDALAYLDESLAVARRIGDRPREWAVLAERTYPLLLLGRWDEVIATREEFGEEQVNAGGVVLSLLQAGVEVYSHRGDFEEARRLLTLFARLEDSTDLQDLGCYFSATAVLSRAEGRHDDALAAGVRTLDAAPVFGLSFQSVKHGLVDAVEAALALGNSEKAEELLAIVERLPPGQKPPYLDAHAKRIRSRMSGDPAGLEAAARLFRERAIPFWVGVTTLEHAELTGSGESRSEALRIFEQLGARPWIERAAEADVKAEIAG